MVYRDQIGNITTSHLRRASRDICAVQLTSRYRLMGYCKKQFWFTYDRADKDKFKTDGMVHEVRVPVWQFVD